MSKKFEQVKRYYDVGLWSEGMVWNAVGRWINAYEFQEIVGKEYRKSQESENEKYIMYISGGSRQFYSIIIWGVG